LIEPFDEIYQFAADMGGAGFVFTGENDADIMHNSVSINLNVLEEQRKLNDTFDGVKKGWTEANRPKLEWKTKIFYSGSACMYPEHNQLDPENPDCRESTAYPANPDSEYGWEKLFSERLYLSYNRNHNMPVRIARYHNIFGPEGTWKGGREKAPAAICRKVAYVPQSGGSIEVWGDGKQTRSFLYIGRFPLNSFSFSLRIFFSIFIPIAFITTIPSEVFLGLSQLWKILLEVIVASVFLITSRKFWLFALKFYSSASS